MRAQLDQHGPEIAIARLAARQHGVVSWPQLLTAGLSKAAIEHRVRAGHLHRLYRGVYAVGHTNLSRRGRWMAAVLACGEGAVLSHRSAAAHWAVRPSSAWIVDVTVPSRTGRARRDGIRLHRSAALPEAEVTRHEEIPVTTVARTLLDLAGDIAGRSSERAVEQAEALRLFDLHDVQATIDRHPTRSGSKRLTEILDTYRGETPSRAASWRRCSSPCAPLTPSRRRLSTPGWRAWRSIFSGVTRASLPRPTAAATTGTRAAFERDRARDARLLVAGFRVVRFTYRQVALEPAYVAATLRALLVSAVR